MKLTKSVDFGTQDIPNHEAVRHHIAAVINS